MTASTHVTWTARRVLTCYSRCVRLQEAIPYHRMNGSATCVNRLSTCLCAVETGYSHTSKPVLYSFKNLRYRPISQKLLLPTSKHNKEESWKNKKKMGTEHLLQCWQSLLDPIVLRCLLQGSSLREFLHLLLSPSLKEKISFLRHYNLKTSVLSMAIVIKGAIHWGPKVKTPKAENSSNVHSVSGTSLQFVETTLHSLQVVFSDIFLWKKYNLLVFTQLEVTYHSSDEGLLASLYWGSNYRLSTIALLSKQISAISPVKWCSSATHPEAGRGLVCLWGSRSGLIRDLESIWFVHNGILNFQEFPLSSGLSWRNTLLLKNSNYVTPLLSLAHIALLVGRRFDKTPVIT